MPHVDVPQFLGLLVLIFLAAKAFGSLARRAGHPAVLGELIAGVLLGKSVFGLIDPADEALRLFAEIGVVFLLLEIGLDTDLGRLLEVGGVSAVIAVVGVTLSFALGYAGCRLLGFADRVAVFAGACLTATSVGITARVLSDLGRLHEPESRVVLGAAVLDDVLGLVILSVLTGLVGGGEVTMSGIARVAGLAVGFLLAALVLGNRLVPPLFRVLSRLGGSGTATWSAVLVALALAWLADRAGLAALLGAFVAGVLLRKTAGVAEIQRGVAQLGHFFVPTFFVATGAAVDVRVFNPFDPANGPTLRIAALLIAAAVAGKLLAGYAPWWFRGRKLVVGVGMIPRGEVELIAAQVALAGGVFDRALYSAVAVMVMVTTFLTPPLLKYLYGPGPTNASQPAKKG